MPNLTSPYMLAAVAYADISATVIVNIVTDDDVQHTTARATFSFTARHLGGELPEIIAAPSAVFNFRFQSLIPPVPVFVPNYFPYAALYDVFPILPGLTWSVTRTPIWKNKIFEAFSGKETSTGFWSYPRWQFLLSYDILRWDETTPEYQAMVGFFNQHFGSRRGFLFQDLSDNRVTGQFIGMGDGVRMSFQAVRTLGGFTEPVLTVNALEPLVIYIDGAATTTYTLYPGGLIYFSPPPAPNTVLSADFSFFWQTRFLNDQYDFEEIMYRFSILKKVDLISLK